MKHTKKIFIITVVAVLATAAAPAFAGKGKAKGSGRGFRDGTGQLEGWGKRGKGFRDKGMRGLSRLDLTAEQKTRIEAIHEDHRKSTETLRKQARDLKEQMRGLWQATTPDEGAILFLHRQIHKIKGELAEYRIQMRIDVLAILTPEQRAEMRSFKEQRSERRKGRRSGLGRGRRGNVDKL
jgi:Spy/CpxP family protein refolding chaperone